MKRIYTEKALPSILKKAGTHLELQGVGVGCLLENYVILLPGFFSIG